MPLQVIVNDDNRSFSDGNNQAARVAGGELLLFLNNDVEPLTPGWLGRLVDTIEAQKAVAVGARLVYPLRREGPRRVTGGRRTSRCNTAGSSSSVPMASRSAATWASARTRWGRTRGALVRRPP